MPRNPTGKLNPEIVAKLGLCWGYDKARDQIESNDPGTQEYTVSEILRRTWIDYGDVMFAVCRPEVTPEGVLRTFAADVAQRLKWRVVESFGEARVKLLRDAVESSLSNDRPRMDVVAREIHKMCRRLIPRSEDKSANEALKCFRSCVKQNPGEAALGAAWHASQSAFEAEGVFGRDRERNWQREHLALLFNRG